LNATATRSPIRLGRHRDRFWFQLLCFLNESNEDVNSHVE
jgi:hypothetical protein